eukprot:CAMPEP_0118942660 /NCGR_PEP_ID=MMETSP1169-20130426/36592_1 /TAXON_ID=36882 /ORGANISM="Pyramimonas obovata, Strain CCMP722" /LENGTH=192 /DNA_ID=CAMNT_0006887713 /DNA_START=59 /DNA_END=635 /DNA_ORIENTATION=+
MLRTVAKVKVLLHLIVASDLCAWSGSTSAVTFQTRTDQGIQNTQYESSTLAGDVSLTHGSRWPRRSLTEHVDYSPDPNPIDHPIHSCGIGSDEVACAFAVGWFHTCAVVEGSVHCWGMGTYGQLGYESSSDVGDSNASMFPPPVQVGEEVVGVAAGVYHTCAILQVAGYVAGETTGTGSSALGAPQTLEIFQ